MSYWNFLKNSLFITIVAVAVSSLIGLLAAIALGRFKFRFRTTYLVMLLIVQLLPQQALVVSLFIDFRKLNLLDSLVGLIARLHRVRAAGHDLDAAQLRRDRAEGP